MSTSTPQRTRTHLAGPETRSVAPWPLGQAHSTDESLKDVQDLRAAVRQAQSVSPWQWPRHRILFIADPHADPEAFVASLVASGGVIRRDLDSPAFELTATGREAEFIIGGDCLDKGPGDLALLHTVRQLIDTGARVTLLAGNHDVRTMIGLRALGIEGDPTTEHLFLRMGPKVVPLLREVDDRYLGDGEPPFAVPDEAECRRRLYPSTEWFEAFPLATEGRLSAKALEREMIRMRRKLEGFEDACAAAGLTMRRAYAAARQCQRLFLADDGEFAWFFRTMQLMHREGSFLFVHAGIDDGLVDLIDRHGIDELNRRFHPMAADDPFGLYHGTLGNCLRTKYRSFELPLTAPGAARARRLGLHAVVHGHHNRTGGQRLVLRQGIMHIESDVTLDRASRRREGLTGDGAGVTIIDPAGYVDGLSADYPDVKRLELAAYLERETG
jgi:hypothetical protein